MSMDTWENWSFSLENEHLVSDLCSKLKSQYSPTTWWELFQHGESVQDVNSQLESEEQKTELNSRETMMVALIREALEANTGFKEVSFASLPFNSIQNIFWGLKNNLDDVSFSSFCEMIASWNNDFLIEEAMKVVVVPKLQEREESSACTIYSLAQLAKAKPSQLCHNVLCTLLSDVITPYTDVELISTVYKNLPTPQQDLVILTLVKKSEIQEKDWLLLQPLVQSLSPASVQNLTEFILRWSHKFVKSQSFGRFLVSFCQNLNFFDNKEILAETIEKHETLFKMQALKILKQSKKI